VGLGQVAVDELAHLDELFVAHLKVLTGLLVGAVPHRLRVAGEQRVAKQQIGIARFARIELAAAPGARDDKGDEREQYAAEREAARGVQATDHGRRWRVVIVEVPKPAASLNRRRDGVKRYSGRRTR